MIIEQGATYEELLQAYYDCRKNKRNSKTALHFELDYETNLLELKWSLNNGTYKPEPLEVFIVTRPVRREIFAAAFRDRVVHHWLINHLNPYFEREFIYDSYACRKGKGTLFGIQRLERFISRCSKNHQVDCWILKLDIQGFFMSIDKQILWQRLKLFIETYYSSSNKKLIKEVSYKVITANPTNNCIFKSKSKDWQKLPKDKSLFYAKKHCGLPIGNLTSQIFANFYMNSFDHFVKSELGIKYYGRYVDDFYIVESNKSKLLDHRKKIYDYLDSKLNLRVHPRKEVLQHYSKGISFLGSVILPGRRYTGKRLKGNFYCALQKQNKVVANKKPTKEDILTFLCIINSYLGFLKHTNSYHLRKKMVSKMLSIWWRSIIIFSNGYTKSSPLIRRVKQRKSTDWL